MLNFFKSQKLNTSDRKTDQNQLPQDQTVKSENKTLAEEKKVHGEDGVCCGGCGGQ